MIVCVVNVELNVCRRTVRPPERVLTVYPVTGEPLSAAGALQCTVAEALPGEAEGDTGAVGEPTASGLEIPCTPTPRELIAATPNRYVVPFVKPAMVCEVAVEAKVFDGCGLEPMYGVIW